MNRMKIAFSDFSPRPMRGQFSMKVYRRGRLVETYSDHNLIVTGAKTAIASLLAGQGTGKAITSIGFGTNGSVPVPEDTELTDAFVKAVTSITFPQEGQIELDWNLLTTEANGKAIMEFGLELADGTLFARKVRSAAINKDTDIALEGQWLIIL